MSGLAIVFPGQGSQFVGMGYDLAQDDEGIRDMYAYADEILGYRLSKLCWEGPDDELRLTSNAQPAIMLHSYAVWRLIRDHVGPKTGIAAGHSLGEISAYVAAGSLEPERGFRLVRRRGELMLDAASREEGSMAAVIGLSLHKLNEVCEQVRSEGIGAVVPANINAPMQIVISGAVAAVQRVGQLAKGEGAKRFIPLPVKGAFHSPLMAVSAPGFADELDQCPMEEPRLPVVSNARAKIIRDVAQVKESLVEQFTAPVRWVECMHLMAEREPDQWLEIGPGKVLSNLGRRIDRSLEFTAVGSSSQVDGVLGMSL